MEGEPLIKSNFFGNTAVKLLLKLWPSVSGSSRAKWSVGCHGSSEADQATQGDGDELCRVHPVQATAKVALSQVETEDEEPQDGGRSVNAPQPGSITTCEPHIFDRALILWKGRSCVPTSQVLPERWQWDTSWGRWRRRRSGCLFHAATPAWFSLRPCLGEAPPGSAVQGHPDCSCCLQWIRWWD